MNGQFETERADLQLVVFTVGGNEFAIYISLVREIINISKLVALPDMPAAMVGIIDVRGTVLPVVDLGKRFAMGEVNGSDFTAQKVLLVEMGESMVGYLVDEVSEVLQVPRQALEKTRALQGMGQGLIQAVCNLEGRLIPLVNADTLLSDQDVVELQNVVKEEAKCFEI